MILRTHPPIFFVCVFVFLNNSKAFVRIVKAVLWFQSYVAAGVWSSLFITLLVKKSMRESTEK